MSLKIHANSIPSSFKKLYYTNDNDISQIKNQEFFTFSKDMSKEFFSFQEAINKQDQNSRALACAFPARYLTLKENIKSTPVYDLKKCVGLQSFLENIPGEHLSILLTSEYFNAPSSAFGHIMLSIHQNSEIQLTDKAIHFSALTNKSDGFLMYSARGLTGGYPGYYIVEPIFKKFHEYSNKEQRYLFSTELSLTSKQLLLFKYHLYELDKAQFDYYFLNQNCAYRIDALLSTILESNATENYLYTLPSSVFNKYSNGKANSKKILPYSTIAKFYIDQLSSTKKNELEMIINGSKKISIDTDPSIGTAYFYYAQYKFKREGIYDNSYKDNMRIIHIKTTEIHDQISSPRERDNTFLVSLGARYNSDYTGLLKIRPVLIDRFSFQNRSLSETQLKVLETQFSYNKKLRLDELNLITLTLFQPYHRFFKDTSWQFSSSLQRMSNEQNLNNLTYFGIGHTYEFLTYFNYFVNIGNQEMENFWNPYLSVETNLFGYLGSNLKYGLNYEYRQFKDEHMTILKSYLNWKLTKNKQLLFETKKYKKSSLTTVINLRFLL
ncbi:DUF4105 domain-containing protein [Bacteriovorax sp. Seq25_V]|uniref:Lnb N-terminal periplasmic domain-containing protein n=1 Tax=Bacteriovorax sp. Seq25_V TaxID=1201288 RepID=UPI0012FBFE21|nr:DUF4105 domain-containing protein [Bacteriovorax sp. Seq25_V]